MHKDHPKPHPPLFEHLPKHPGSLYIIYNRTATLKAILWLKCDILRLGTRLLSSKMYKLVRTVTSHSHKLTRSRGKCVYNFPNDLSEKHSSRLLLQAPVAIQFSYHHISLQSPFSNTKPC